MKWTPSDTGFVKTNIDSMTYGKMGEVLGRSRNSVQWKCNKLGLFKQISSQGVKDIKSRLKNRRFNGLERGFLIGVLEADGVISIVKTHNSLIPFFGVNNTDKDIVYRIHDILKKHNIHSTVSSWKRRRGSPVFRVSLHRCGDVLLVLNDIKDKFVSERNKQRAEILRNFCMARLNAIEIFGHNAPSSQHEILLYHKILKFNKKGIKVKF